MFIDDSVYVYRKHDYGISSKMSSKILISTDLKIAVIEEPRSKLRGMFCRAAEPTGNALAVSVQ